MTAIVVSLILVEPSSRVLTFTGPSELKKANHGGRRSLATMPLSLAVLRFTSMNGAPVSKMNRYGPLPLIFTLTAMCLLWMISKGTALGSAAETGSVNDKRIAITPKALHIKAQGRAAHPGTVSWPRHGTPKGFHNGTGRASDICAT